LAEKIFKGSATTVYEVLVKLHKQYKFLTPMQMTKLCNKKNLDKSALNNNKMAAECKIYDTAGDPATKKYEHSVLDRINSDLNQKLSEYQRKIDEVKTSAYAQFANKSLEELVQIIYGYEAGQKLNIVSTPKKNVSYTGGNADGNLKKNFYYPIYIGDARSELLTTNAEIINMLDNSVLVYESTNNYRPINIIFKDDEGKIKGVNIDKFDENTNTYGKTNVIVVLAKNDVTIDIKQTEGNTNPNVPSRRGSTNSISVSKHSNNHPTQNDVVYMSPENLDLTNTKSNLKVHGEKSETIYSILQTPNSGQNQSAGNYANNLYTKLFKSATKKHRRHRKH